MRSESFGRLLKAGIGSIATCEVKTAPVVEDELGQQIGVSAASIQRYKAGHLPPEPRTLEILAEAAVKRGYLNREWLQHFLHAARHPAPGPLIERLCPAGPARAQPTRVYQNLPAPTYSQFIPRPQPEAEILDGLQQRSAVVLIASLGGMGKTSLAREVAARCLQAGSDGPKFDSVVWVSDKDRPGTTTLSIVLDEIARTLDYPGFTQFEHEEKRREVGQLLRRQKVLLVVDNFETITDGALLGWLLRLPEPSKTIVTTREYTRAFRNNTSVLDLRGMSKSEAQALIGQRLRFLKIERLVSDPAQLAPLIAATGGNPKAIEIALGLIKHEHRPLQQIVDDLYAARGTLFDDLFTRAWALLDEAARRVLLVMTFFPASASGEALSATADVQGFAFDRAVERLMDLALLDAQQAHLNSTARYTLHALVRAFAGARLAEVGEFERGARERWVGWYMQLASRVGFSWNDLSKLDLLDPEEETTYSVFIWTLQNGRYPDAIRMARDVYYYYYVRGFWDKKQEVERLRAEAAYELHDIIEEIKALSYYIQMLGRRGEIEQAEQHLPKLYKLTKSMKLSENTLFHIHHAEGLYWLARFDPINAQKAWQKSLPNIDRLSTVNSIADRQWIATCYHYQGAFADAQQFYSEALSDAMKVNYQRGILYSQYRLAAIHLELGNLEQAAVELKESITRGYQYQDRRNIAEIQLLYARLHTLRGDLPAARVALAEAIDLFERLGMRRELAEARAEMARLESPGA